MQRKIIAAVIFSTLLITSAALVSASKLKDVKLADKVDNDGDGYISKFSIEITANTKINEKGEDYDKQFWMSKGDPAFAIDFATPIGPVESGAYKDIGFKDGEQTHKVWFEVGDFEKRKTDPDEFKLAKEKTMIMKDITSGKVPLKTIVVKYVESDMAGLDAGLKDESIASKPLRIGETWLEHPNNDKSKPVTIRSNPGGATLYVNGEEKGKTEWNGQLPIDLYEREGMTKIKLEKEGYQTLSTKAEIRPPTDERFQLKKIKKPIVVDSQPQGATVRVNGQKIGETPLSKEYWVNEEFDVRVEMDGYETVSFEDVSAPWQKTVGLKSTEENTSETNDTNDTSGSYNLGTLPGMYTYDTYTDLTSQLDYQYYNDLITQLPSLAGFLVAKFTAAPMTANVDEEIEFDAAASYYTRGNITTYEWDFGDGETATGETTTHSYDSAGTYTVELMVEDASGNTTTATKQITVKNLKPKPQFIVSSKRIETGTSVVFDADLSQDADGTITSYEWDFGDGNTDTGEKVSHAFSSSGDYIVELEVEDNSGVSETLTKQITVREPNNPPNPSFAISDTNPQSGTSVSFDASNSNDDGSIESYYWSFGDGESGEGQQASHSYRGNGTYTVKLTAVDDDGESANTTKTLVVKGDSDDAGNETADETDSNEESEEESGFMMIVRGLCRLVGIC